ncbi:MAG TPA: hypothetical protein VEZ16_11075 [Microvirga sp.]|nr:hypothetical protein [Microvirga sp.]
MICAFCQQDVKNPCHNIHEMRQRAEHHIDRCENAFVKQGGGSRPQRAPSGDIPSGGKI